MSREESGVGQCPFCGSQVAEALVVDGGTCPRCFAEIPGEEAVTDPGVDVKAAEDRSDRLRRSIPRALGLGMFVLVVGCTGCAALLTVVWPEPQMAETLDFDALDYPMPDLVAVAAAEAPSPADRVSRAAQPERGSPAPSTTGNELPPTPAPGTDEPGTRRPAPTAIAGPTTRVATSAGAAKGPSGLSLDLPKVRRDDNVVLSDAVAIREMIGERMVEYIPGLQLCYDRRLKLSPTLKGRWRVKFEVTTDGVASGATATALDKRDGELESCLAEHIEENWRFGKITVTQPVQRTLTFHPG